MLHCFGSRIGDFTIRGLLTKLSTFMGCSQFIGFHNYIGISHRRMFGARAIVSVLLTGACLVRRS